VALHEHRKKLGQALRRHRERAGLTQEALAEKAELTAKYLGEVERGLVNISLDSLVRLAKALKSRVTELTREI
jgi:transcriptional regulator with XRE-family HTH domain